MARRGLGIEGEGSVQYKVARVHMDAATGRELAAKDHYTIAGKHDEYDAPSGEEGAYSNTYAKTVIEKSDSYARDYPFGPTPESGHRPTRELHDSAVYPSSIFGSTSGDAAGYGHTHKGGPYGGSSLLDNMVRNFASDPHSILMPVKPSFPRPTLNAEEVFQINNCQGDLLIPPSVIGKESGRFAFVTNTEMYQYKEGVVVNAEDALVLLRFVIGIASDDSLPRQRDTQACKERNYS